MARSLAEAGANVALIYSSTTDAIENAAKIATDTGVRVQAFQSNVTLRNEDCGDHKGLLDVVVANSGTCTNSSALEYMEATWQRDNRVNYDGVMWTAQAAGKIFRRQGNGNLIITVSVSSILVNIPQTQAAYNASKTAAVHLTKSLAVEWMDFARVNCLSPGFFLTKGEKLNLN